MCDPHMPCGPALRFTGGRTAVAELEVADIFIETTDEVLLDDDGLRGRAIHSWTSF